MAGLVGKTLGHYRLVQQIGQGGMATVYRAEDSRTGAVVALKVLSPTIGSDVRFVKRFRREAGLVSRLKHPHIVPVYYYGEDQGLIFLIMPFIEGDTLHDRIQSRRVSEEQSARWVKEIASALTFAHEHGVIHRDVKPSNVLIDREDKAHLGDFGLARMIEGSNTLTGSMMMGTPAYLSPEQARGTKLDARSDQYSFGVVLYELFTGRLPFEGDNPMSTALKHLQDPVPRPGKVRPGLPSGLERVILKSMAKDPEDRFPSVTALNEACQAALQGDPLEWIKPTELIRRPEAGPAAAPEPAPAPRRLAPAWGLLALVGLMVGLGALARPTLGALTGGWSIETEVSPEASVQAAGPTQALGPTATPTPVSTLVAAGCPDLRIDDFRTEANSAAWLLVNDSSEPIRISDLAAFTAPGENRALERVLLGERVLFGGAGVSGGQFAWQEGADLGLAAGDRQWLQFEFSSNAGPRGYVMSLVFDNGCRLEGAW